MRRMSRRYARGVKDAVANYKTVAGFRTWLAANHARSDGIWLRIFKKGSGLPGVTYAEALGQARAPDDFLKEQAVRAIIAMLERGEKFH